MSHCPFLWDKTNSCAINMDVLLQNWKLMMTTLSQKQTATNWALWSNKVWLPYCILLSRDLLSTSILSYIKLTIISRNLVLQNWLYMCNYQLCTQWTPENSKINSNTSSLTSDCSDVKFCPTASLQIFKMVKLISSHHVLTSTWWKLKSHFHDIYFTFINKLVTKQNINSP